MSVVRFCDMARQSTPRAQIDIELIESTTRMKRTRDGVHYMAPVMATLTPLDDDELPTLRLRLDVHDGRIVVVEAHLIGTPEVPLRSDEMRSWSLPKMAAMAMSVVAAEYDPETGGFSGPIDVGASTVVRAVRARESVGTERLTEVSRLFLAGGINGVIAGAYVSRSQAYRLVKQAREAGLLEEDS